MEKSKSTNTKRYDLEDRTRVFAKDCRRFVSNLKKTIGNMDDGRQLIRSSGSIAANYIEANEAISKKDFTHRIKICRKEAKESILWLDLCEVYSEKDQMEKDRHIQEATELMKIFGAILQKTK